MLARLIVLSIFLATVSVGLVHSISRYTIVAPAHIRPHSDYRVSLSLHEEYEPARIRLSIEDEKSYKNSLDVTLESNRTKIVKLRIDDLNVGNDYKFVAEGLSGLRFRNESNLRIESKNHSLFIQTDKGIYKPSETVRFRVLVLDSSLRPAKLTPNEPLVVEILDSNNLRVRAWKHAEVKKGVFSGELQLADVPMLGQWSIIVRHGDEVKNKGFEVAEYVLPKFDVQIDAPRDISIKDESVRIIVRSKYTYGKPVKGEAIVSMKQSHSQYYYQMPYPSFDGDGWIIKTVPIDGKGSVRFHIENDLKLDPNEQFYSRNFEIMATVIEDLSGRNYTAIGGIIIHQNRFKIDVLERKSYFFPGLALTFPLRISNQDNSPFVLNEEMKTAMIGKYSYRYGYGEENKEEFFAARVSRNGTVVVRVPTKAKEEHFFLKMKFMGEEFDLGYYYVKPNDSPGELTLEVLSQKPTLRRNVFVEVRSKDPMTEFSYQLIARGKILQAENVRVPERKYHVVKFLANFDMVPSVSLIVYFFKDGKIVTASVRVKIEDDLNNEVKLKLSSNQAAPGKDVGITVLTKRNSLVGLAAVDQSVLLLRENHGLTIRGALSEIDAYQHSLHLRKYENYSSWHREHWDFDQANAILFTNANPDRGVSNTLPIVIPVSSQSGGLSVPMSAHFESNRIVQSAVYVSEPEAMPIPAPVLLRTEFPETWLWETIDLENTNGTIVLTRKVPDTITSWSISAFALSPEFGLGLTKAPKSLQVFQPFFISLNLPYSVKRGEVVAIPVVVFNYMVSDVDAELTLHNENNEFQFVVDEAAGEQKRSIHVPANGGISQSFMVRFNTVGVVSIKATAVSPLAGDGIVRVLQVEPEGVKVHQNKPFFVDLRHTDRVRISKKIEVPETAVPGSLHVAVNVIGNLLGSVTKNLQELIRLPVGCGEQNMLKLVPNIVVLDYLKATGELKPAVEAKALRYMSSGYQKQLIYIRGDGSFSSFGRLDKSGSVWLTAFVLKSFVQAKKFIEIDGNTIDFAAAWLTSKQNVDGSFAEIGTISHAAMQSHSHNNLALTAYVAAALSEFPEEVTRNSVSVALDYVAERASSVDDVYSLAVAAYALQSGNHAKKAQILELFLGKALQKNQQKWWSHTANKKSSHSSKTINVEITAYGLLALIKAGRLEEGLPVFRWLVSKLNDQGGFEGSQDTIVGLAALAKYAEHLSSPLQDIKIKVTPSEGGAPIEVEVNRENALVLQGFEMKSAPQSILVEASGKGVALFQVAYSYNLNEKDADQSFALKPSLNVLNPGHIVVDVCATFKPLTLEANSNMVVMEVGLPTGYTLEKEFLVRIMHVEGVKMVETKKSDSVAVIYIEQMASNVEKCLQVDGFRAHKVAEQKPVAVRIYDYYDSSRTAREFYSMPSIHSCDICEGEECSKACK